MSHKPKTAEDAMLGRMGFNHADRKYITKLIAGWRWKKGSARSRQRQAWREYLDAR